MSTILIIDDNDDYRAGFKEILELEQYTTLEAKNGLIGLHMIRQYSPTLIICDVDMPVMNGMELLRVVKSDPVYAKTPFIIITGHRDEIILNKSRHLGVDGYLTKPVAIPEFLSTVSQFLKERDTAAS